MTNSIYIFTNAISRKNGGSSSLLDLANGLEILGYNVVLFSSFGFLDKLIYRSTDVSNNLKLFVLPPHIFSLIHTSKLKRLLNRICNFRSVFNNHSFKETIVLDGVGLPADFILKLKALKSKVIYNHAGSPNAAMLFFGRNGNRASNLKNINSTYLKMINLYTHILFQSSTQAKKLYDLAKWSEDKTLVLRPSVSTIDIDKVKNTPSIFNKNEFNMVVVGSVQERKGQHLLPAISKNIHKKISNLKIHIVGPIIKLEYKKQIVDLINKFDQEKHIVFHGFKSNYLEFINSADVILQVSEEEGVSRILREAMALKKVIISFRLDGTNDLLVDKEDCLLCEYGDLNSLCKNILSVYQDKKLFNLLAQNAFENFNQKYSHQQYLKQLNSILTKIS